MIIQTFTQIFAVIASANEDKYAYLMFSLPYEHIHSSLVISLVFSGEQQSVCRFMSC